MDKDIWKDLTDAKTPTIIETRKHPLTKGNLMDYMTRTPTEDINAGTFLDYFDRQTIDKPLPGTENYLSHALFDMYFKEEKIMAMFQFIFDYISPWMVSEKHGLNYLMALFNRSQPLSKKSIINILNQAKEIGVDFSSRDYEWNTLLHWALVGNGSNFKITDIYPYLDKDFYIKKGSPASYECGFFSTNKQDFNCYDLPIFLIGYLYKTEVISHDFDFYLDYLMAEDFEECAKHYDKWKISTEDGYLFRIFNSPMNWYSRNLLIRLGLDFKPIELDFDYDLEYIKFARSIPVLRPKQLAKIGSYKPKKDK